jgi:hypothetical protein
VIISPLAGDRSELIKVDVWVRRFASCCLSSQTRRRHPSRQSS